jgi:hypothetical protein
MPRATLVLREKVIDNQGNILDVDIDQLLSDFTADVARIMGESRWPRR